MIRSLWIAAAAGTMIPAAVAFPTLGATAEARQPRYYQGRTWVDDRGHMRCRRPNGTVGLIVGGAGGALIGRAIDTRGDRATGTLIGAAAGALVGRHIDRRRMICR